MNNIFLTEFLVLFAASLVGCTALLPYSLQMIKSAAKGKPLKLSMPAIMALSFVQTAFLSAVSIVLGLLAIRAVGLGAPYLQAIILHYPLPALATLLKAATLGLLVGVFFLVFDFICLPYLPKALVNLTRGTSLRQGFAASVYGGINEELLLRWFGLSSFIWLFSKLLHVPPLAASIFWAANIVMAVLFGLGHLPSTKQIAGRITPFLITRALLLNGVLGLVCGLLFWRYGIECAMAAHFFADIIYQPGAAIVVRLNDRFNFRQVSPV